MGEYKLVIENKTSNGEKKKATASNSKDDGIQVSNNALTDYLKVVAPVGYAVNVADRLVTHQINTITLRTGYEELQAQSQFCYGLAKRTAKIGMNIATGAYMGNVFGAVIGAVTGISNELIDMSLKQNEINIKRANENTSIFLNSIRTGAGANRQGKTE